MDIEAASSFLAATAKVSGLTFDPDKLLTASAELSASVERAANGMLAYTSAGYSKAFRIANGETTEIPVSEHVAGLIRRNTQPIPAETLAAVEQNITTSPAPSSAPVWAQRGNGPVSAFARALAERQDAALVAETEQWPNPWLPAQANRTRQHIMVNKNPALAAKMRKEAGL